MYLPSIVVLLAVTSNCRGDVILNFTSSGPDVVASYFGTLNLNGRTSLSTSNPNLPNNINPGFGNVILNSPVLLRSLGTMTPVSLNFGSNITSIPTSVSGDTFGFSGSTIYYSSANLTGDVLTVAGSATFAGQSFASLGIAPGTYVKTLVQGSGNIVVNAVPEPTGLTIFGVFVCMVSFRRRRINS
ncbi:MAG: hypothetical protein KDB03_18965 [Planctomycetales bacterium]|nr:hypothetical protein [Planctomycetales bacterium]